MSEPTFGAPDCSTCGDEHRIEMPLDSRRPWATVEVPCPDCCADDDPYDHVSEAAVDHSVYLDQCRRHGADLPF